MPKEIKEKIKSFLLGIITTQNEINKGILNQEGIDYICEKATNYILELFAQREKQILEEISGILATAKTEKQAFSQIYDYILEKGFKKVVPKK